MILQGNPPSLDFGQVNQGNSATLGVLLFNDDWIETIIVTSVTSDNPKFVPVTPGSFSIGPRATISCSVAYTAGTPGTDIGNISAISNADNNPAVLPCTAVSVATGTKSLSINPNRFVFANTKQNTNSAPTTIVVTNTGTVNCTVQVPTVASPFTGVGLPGSPTVLAPAGTLSFQAEFSPTGGGYIFNAQAITITSDAPASPQYVTLEGLGVTITPAYIATGGVENGYAAVGALLQQFQATNFNTESFCNFTKLFSLQGPGFVAKMIRMEFQYEDKGVASIQVTLTNEFGGTASSPAVVIGTAPAPGTVKHAMIDLVITGELINAVVNFSGPVIIDAYMLRWVDGGEVKT
jgi:hypothetical protein